jgi:hypothetical protein
MTLCDCGPGSLVARQAYHARAAPRTKMVGVTPARRGCEPHTATILSGEKQIAVAAYDKAIRKALSARSSVARCSGNKLQETDRQRATSACLRHRRLDRALREHEARARRTRAGACHRGVIGDTDPSFAYAQGWDAVHGTYEGLSLAKSATINLRSDGLLVRRDVADPVLRWAVGLRPARGASGATEAKPAESSPAPGASSASSRSMLRTPGLQISQIAQAIIAEQRPSSSNSRDFRDPPRGSKRAHPQDRNRQPACGYRQAQKYSRGRFGVQSNVSWWEFPIRDLYWLFPPTRASSDLAVRKPVDLA